VATAEEKPGGWALTVVHTSGELEFAVICVVPGGEASKHHHREAVGLLRVTQGRRCHRGYDGVGRGRRIPHEYPVSWQCRQQLSTECAITPSEAPFVFLIADTRGQVRLYRPVIYPGGASIFSTISFYWLPNTWKSVAVLESAKIVRERL